MTARKLTPQELYLSRRNMAVAFEGEFDFEKELERSKTEEADASSDHYGAFAGSPQDPVASIIMNRYDVRFDGHTVKMGGVGGVSSLPPYRRGGAVRACMQASLRDLYAQGFAFSALYPFSTAFYRKFGFENAEPCRLWEVPLKNLPLKETEGSIFQLLPGDDLSPLLQVYNAVYGNVNLSVVRGEYDKALREKNFLDQKRSVFVWKDENGVPGAFLIGGRDGEVLNCRTDFPQPNALLFRDLQALTGLLSFVRRAFISNFDSIRFGVPDYLDLSNVIPEASGICGQFLFNGMVRAVSAELVLSLCRCKGAGELTLELTDPMIPENNGVFRLTFAPGTENRVERVTAKPDAVLGMGELGQLLCGIKTADDLPWMPGAQVKNDSAPLDSVFYRKPCHILNLF